MDVLLVAAPDIGRVARAVAEGSSTQNGNSSRPFSEVASTITIEGRTWGLAEITRPSPISGDVSGVVGLNELATQANSSRREWVVLTNMGANVIVRQRPVDTLLGVLEGTALGGGGGNSEVGIFFERSVILFAVVPYSRSRADQFVAIQLRSRSILRDAADDCGWKFSTQPDRISRCFSKSLRQRWKDDKYFHRRAGEVSVLRGRWTSSFDRSRRIVRRCVSSFLLCVSC